MKLTSFLMQSRGPVNLAKRIPTIVSRFGISEHKIDGCLNRFIDITQEFDLRPTLAVTANLLDRYPDLFHRMADKGVEFAVHGLIHTDYSGLSLESHLAHINEAVEIFSRHNIDFSGFRCPYLRSNEHTLEAVRRLGFAWESSDVIVWDVLDRRALKGNPGFAYRKLLDLYSAKNSITRFSVPRIKDGVVEIPVSIPDDEAIADRLGLHGAEAITQIWLAILEKSYKRGDVFTVQLHHERVPLFEQPLRTVLREAKVLKPSVYIASLGEIAQWYLKRDRFHLDVEDARDFGPGHHRVSLLNDLQNPTGKFTNEAEKKDRNNFEKSVGEQDYDITVLVKNAQVVDAQSSAWFNGYRIVHADRFVLRCKKRPVVTVDSGSTQEFIDLIKSEGFVVQAAKALKISKKVETDDSPQGDKTKTTKTVRLIRSAKTEQTVRPVQYINPKASAEPVYLADRRQDAAKIEINEVALMQDIESSGDPLVRIWRWPSGCRSAIAVTGDIDSITLTDFARRFFEVRNERAA